MLSLILLIWAINLNKKVNLLNERLKRLEKKINEK